MVSTINHGFVRFRARWLAALGFALNLSPTFGQSSVSAEVYPPISLSISASKIGQAGAPSLEYISVFAGYQALADQPIASWRESNQVVGEIGGWRAYAKEASQGDSATTATDSPASHADHGKKP